MSDAEDSGSDSELDKPRVDDAERDEPRRQSLSPRPTLKRRADGSLDKFGWKKPRGYASPVTYAHLRPIDDCLEKGLKCTLRSSLSLLKMNASAEWRGG